MYKSAVVALLVASAPSFAEDAATDRFLGGHLFQLPMLQRSAFVETSFGVRLGGASYQVEPGEVSLLGGQNLELIGITEGASLSVRLVDWLAVEVGASAAAVVGSNGRSLLLQGGSASFDADGGLTVRAFRLDSGTQVSLRAFGGRRNGREVGLLPLLGATIRQPGATLESVASGDLSQLLSTPVKEWSLGGGVYGAQAFGRLLSLQASVALHQRWITESPFDPSAGARVNEESEALVVSAGLAAGVDFARFHVPVALLAEYLFTGGRRTEVGGEERNLSASHVGVGLFYSGRQSLQLGIAGSTSFNGERVRVRGPEGGIQLTDTPSLYTGQFVFRYFW